MTESGRKAESGRRAVILVAVAVVAFLAGFGWQYLRARELAGRLAVAEREAAFARLGGTLAAATIEAQHGSYEAARQLSSEFFSRLQSNVGLATVQTQPAFDEILAERDEMITSLSRANPQSSTALAGLYTRYRQVLGETVAPAADTPAARPPADTAVPIAPADTPTDTLVTTTTTGG